MQRAVSTMVNDEVHPFGQIAKIGETDGLKSSAVSLFEMMPLVVVGNDHDDGELGSLEAVGESRVDFRFPHRTERHENDRSAFSLR